MDRQHLPSHKSFADCELRFHTLRHTMVPSWETTLFSFFFFLMWLLLSVAVPKLRRLATRTILKHRFWHPSKANGGTGREAASTLCMAKDKRKHRAGLGQGLVPFRKGRR